MTLTELAHLPHHDGSERFVARTSDGPDEPVTVFLLQPPGSTWSSVAARYAQHGDVLYVPGEVDRTNGEGRWWRFQLPSERLSYRFQWCGDDGTVTHLNGEGTYQLEPTDAADFRHRAIPLAPPWARDSVAYYVFLDRFWRHATASSDERPLSEWEDPVAGNYPANVHQFYGGDLAGVRARLDHIDRLGARLLMLSPFFPAPESHRYCASSFDRVDPLLGGDEALSRLVTAVHEREMRCIGDLTLNHCGSTHEWFRRAVASASSTEAKMFSFLEHPDRYLAYRDVPSLPKLNYGHAGTHERMYAKDSSVVRHWLRPPFDLDGWRFDVAAMVGRQPGVDANLAVAQGARTALAAERPDAFHVAEILPDPSPDLRDGRWAGSYLDAGFLSPVRRFCTPPDPRRPGSEMSAIDLYNGLRRFAAALPWDALVSSVGFVGSHDQPRLRSVVGSRQAALFAHFLLLTFPSIPMLYAGDELGVLGSTADTGRAPMPWPGTGLPSDPAMLDEMRALVSLRASSRAFVAGGFRWLAATNDALVYERCSHHARVICVASRKPGRLSFRLPVEPHHIDPLLSRGATLRAPNLTVTCEIDTDFGYGAWLV